MILRFWMLLPIVVLVISMYAQDDPIANRVAVRMVDGQAQFYDTVTNERFIPRGVNYIDFQAYRPSIYEDRVFATNIYNPERVRAAFRNLADYGYNTARIFIDTCGQGVACIGNSQGEGLNPAYLDNIVDTMYIAGEEGIYLLLTANSVPDNGGYWSYFDSQYYDDTDNPFFEAGHLNGAYMVEEGFEVHRRYWRDLMQGITERNAPTEVLLGWQLFNEHWFFGDKPPFTLTEGMIDLPFGSYDLSDAEQKRLMGVDATAYMITQLAPIVREYDPDTLVTIGFFAPDFPNIAGFGGSWDTDTAPLLERDLPVDFWDFHAYADTGMDIVGQAENFGMIGYTEKPIIMGETGIGKTFAFSGFSAASLQARWNAASCAVGFQGWLQWGYYPWPEDLGGQAWAFLDDDGAMLEILSPRENPDPCQASEFVFQNLLYQQLPTASNAGLVDEPPSHAVDGGSLHYCPEGSPPQWIEVSLAQASTIYQVAGAPVSWPSERKRIQFWVRLSNGISLLLNEYDVFISDETSLVYDLPIPIQQVTHVRYTTLTGEAWPCWFEVEALGHADGARVVEGDACVVQSTGSVNLRAEPTTSAESAGTLALGEGAYIDGFARGVDGFRWWHLPHDVWVREDVVTETMGCSFINEVSAE